MIYNSMGFLEVNVSGGGVGLPIEDAEVTVVDPESGNVIEEIRTDSSGNTQTIELPAPPEEFSLGASGERPYSVYDVRAKAKGFDTVNISGVQILPGCTSLEPLSLRAETPSDTVRDYFSPEHVLWGDYPAKIPEADVKPLPDATGLSVLPAPVIPEYVIVHLGRPENYSAEDVWVPFKDYVKNCASSEIYATWPQETLKANILAIISFVLNRVYTEWYRGKGYDFTITNNTAFDQAFQYGRSIFREISVVVDDLFTTYVTKPGIRQPLFTQYCDGKKVLCQSGMRQWGSKDLGESGYDALSILRNYYGGDIYLTSAQKVEGVPRSYGGVVLENGSYGNDVRTIQLQLNSIAKNYPAIGAVIADGVYGAATQRAVSAFQKIFNLPVSGKVDFSTWYQISNIYVAVEKLAELP